MTEINPNTTAKIIIPPKGNSLSDEEKRQEILDTLQGITSSQIESIGEKMLKNAEQREAEQQKAEQKKAEQIKELYGDKEKILENLKENYVKVEENVEMEGYQGKKVHIDLPAVGEFEGLKLEYFVSDEKMTSEDFEGNPKLKKKLYSMKDVGELLKTMNRYMKAMGVETDVDINYKNDLKYWRKEGKDGCEAGDCLKQITGLDFIYWLKDKNVDWKIKSRVGWYCRDKKCCFSRSKTIYDRTNLFLGLFD